MNKVKELRERMGIQQKELAIMVGISRPTVSEWEHQKKDPSGERLFKLSQIFGVSTGYILGFESGEKEKAPVTENDIKFALFNGLDGVTDEDYEEVKRYARYLKIRKNL